MKMALSTDATTPPALAIAMQKKKFPRVAYATKGGIYQILIRVKIFL